MLKRLYLLRHGEADHPDREWNDDSKRPLTAEGRQKMEAEARGMKALRIAIDEIITSPYVRARQTADVVAEAYRLIDRMTESEHLEPGASLSDLRKSLAGVKGESVLVVGHSPDLGHLVGRISGVWEIHLGKGTLAWISLDDGSAKENSGRLKALLPADLLSAAGRL